MKKTFIAIAALLPAMVFAGTAKTTNKTQYNTTTVAKAETLKHTAYTLDGITEVNAKEVEKAAKDAGADKVHIDAKTGKVSITAKKFDAQKFNTEVGKIQGVTVKN